MDSRLRQGVRLLLIGVDSSQYMQCKSPGFGSRNRGSVDLEASEKWARQLSKGASKTTEKLGLGVRSRNLWNGRWWARVRFCSSHCEARYGLERYDAHARPWRTSSGTMRVVSRRAVMLRRARPRWRHSQRGNEVDKSRASFRPGIVIHFFMVIGRNNCS